MPYISIRPAFDYAAHVLRFASTAAFALALAIGASGGLFRLANLSLLPVSVSDPRIESAQSSNARANSQSRREASDVGGHNSAAQERLRPSRLKVDHDRERQSNRVNKASFPEIRLRESDLMIKGIAQGE